MSGGKSIRWGWIGAAGAAVLFAMLALQFYLRNLAEPKLLDFMSYWAAGQLAWRGTPAAAWDVAAHARVMAFLTAEGGVLPFPYPPPFLFPVLAVSWLPYPAAFAAWVLGTGAFYLWSARRVAPGVQAAAQPAVLINSLIGQNGFLTAGVFFAGATRLGERPFMAGAILGTLIVKPQLALMLPVAVVAARAWPAIGGAALSAAGLLLAGWLAFGTASYVAFFEFIPQVSRWMAQDKFAWAEFASIFANLRTIGVAPSIAMTVHLMVAAGAAALCWAAWRGGWEQRVPVLCAASLLGSPYLQNYDTLLMLAPIGWFLTRQPKVAWGLYLLCLLPVLTQIGLWSAPDAGPVAAVLSLLLLWRERLRTGVGPSTTELRSAVPLPILATQAR